MDLSALPTVDYAMYKERLDNLIATVANKLDREPMTCASHPAAAPILRGWVLISRNTYHTIRYFCAEIPHDPARRPEFALSATPLLRSVADALANTVYLLDDPTQRTVEFLKSGWKELSEERDRFLATYGANPSWQATLARQARDLEDTKTAAAITLDEESGRTKLPIWPRNVSQMYNAKSSLAQDRKDFLRHLNDWFYKQFSQDAHLSWPGLRRRGSILVQRQVTDEQRAYLRKLRSDAYGTSMTLMIALLSEVEMSAKYGIVTRLEEFWGLLCPFWGEAKELYELRYSTMLR